MQKRYLSAKELPKYMAFGRDCSVRLAREAGAEIHYGPRRKVYDIQKIDEYMESLRTANS